MEKSLKNKKIKKMNRKMPIHSSRDLKISVDEIKNLLGYFGSIATTIVQRSLLS